MKMGKHLDLDDLTADHPQARRELEQLRADAELYRWLSARMLAALRAESDRLKALAKQRRKAEANAMAADAVGIVAAPGQYPAPPLFFDLDDIEAMLGFALPAEFLTLTLGIPPMATDDGAPLFNPCQWGDICDALLAHINRLKEIHS